MKESRKPFLGLRRVIWVAFFGSSCIGILVMGLRASSGQIVSLNDFGIQFGAMVLFGFLLFFDRNTSD